MDIQFALSNDQLVTLLQAFSNWYEKDEREKNYAIEFRQKDLELRKTLLNQEYLSKVSADDLAQKIFEYSRTLEGPAHIRLGMPIITGELKNLKRNLTYLVDSPDDPFRKAQEILEGKNKIPIFAKAFWTPLFQAKYPDVLPNWNNKTENFFEKVGIKLKTSKLNIEEKYRLISGAFLHFQKLDPNQDFHNLNHLMHFGTVIDEGVALIERLLNSQSGEEDNREIGGNRMNDHDFNKFCREVDPLENEKPERKVVSSNGMITFGNRSGETFQISIDVINGVLEKWREHNGEIEDFILRHDKFNKDSAWEYSEKPYRDVFTQTGLFEDLGPAKSQARSQTKGLMYTINKYIGYQINNKNCEYDSILLLDKKSIDKFFVKLSESHKTASALERDASYLKEAFTSICDFCKKYNEKDGPYLASDPEVLNVLESLRAIQVWIDENFNRYRDISLDVKISRGSGYFPRVPWICILPPEQKVKNGIYVAFCFGREGAGAVVGCAESVANRKGIKVELRSEREPLSINVNGGDLPTHYNDAFENPMEITPDSFEVIKLSEHIQKSLDLCFAHLSLITEPPESEKLGEIEKDILPNFISTIKDYLKFKETDIKRFITSLLSKPFIILTGNSGTGKTKIAHTFVKWISHNMESRFALVPVGSDWTDNRNLLGFLNLLRKDSEAGNGIFQTTPVLDLTLSALNDPTHPYFLILDEMNLSHVERYFSDYLSSMESMESIPIHNEESEIYTSSGKKIKNKIAFPANMYVIGTVNIDETTYMFSPKVLDRANVIEFQVESEQFVSFLSNPLGSADEFTAAPDLTAESFLNLSYKARGIALEGQTLQILEDPPDIENIKKYLESFFELLSLRSMEFAFRTANEILRYVRVDYQLAADMTSWDWKDCLDIQVLQKILPKLHGSRRKLEAMLVALAAFCESGKLLDGKEYLKSTANLNNYSTDTEKQSEEILFRLSHKKLTTMIDAIRRDQFVSFIQ